MLLFQQKEAIMEKYLGIFKRCPLFEGVKDSYLRTLLDCLMET